MYRIRQYITSYHSSLCKTNNYSYVLTLVIILAIGFYLRSYSLFVGESFHVLMINDEITAFTYALNLLNLEGTSWYLSPSFFSGGQAPGPLWTLFVIFIYKLGLSNITGALFVLVFFNTATIYIVHRLALNFLLPRPALFTTLLFATSPWAIYYAVGIYNPIPTIFFGALLFLSLYNSVSNEQDRAIFWVCVLAAALPHFHMVTLFLYPAIVFILWKSRSQINIKFFTFGIAAGITLYLPYLIGDGLNGWENTKLILSGENKPFSFSVMKVITAPITMLSNAPTGWIGRELDDHQGYFEFGTKYFGHYSVLLILNLINLSIILSLFFRFSFRGFISFKEGLLSTESYKNNRKLIFLFLLIITPLLIYLITGRNFATRYTLIILSLLFIMKVLVISKLLNPKASKLITSYFFINIILSVYIVITYNNYMEMMINESKSFYPSIYKLEKIKENIYSEFKTPVHVDVKLSKEILNMPESQQKLYRAVREYIDVENRKTPKDTSDKRELLVVKTGESYDVQKYKKIIYKSPSIVILW